MIYFILIFFLFFFVFIVCLFNFLVLYFESDEDMKSDDGENESFKVK